MSARNTWLTVGLALALVLAVMGWVTATLLELDDARLQSEQQAVVEEQARLSLWRIDSTMAPILSREVAALDAAAAASPDALAGTPAPDGIVLRFSLTRHQLRPLSRADADALAVLERDLEPETLLARLSSTSTATFNMGAQADDRVDETEGVAADGRAVAAVDKGSAAQRAQTPYALKTQALRNEDEWSRRKANVEDNLMAYSTIRRSLNQDAQNLGEGGAPEPDFRTGPVDATIAGAGVQSTVIEPLWVGEHLLLVRRTGDERVEGSWLDWPALQRLLLGEVEDLLPAASLVPVPQASPADTERMLATLPARLETGATIPPPPSWSPLRASLLAGWLIVLAAFAALIALVKVSLGLSERRAEFVSAVTHELRTPLTTFRMYTEMLSEGMVEHKRERYVATLRREAERLSGLVENVLSYARVESDRAAHQPEVLSLGLLFDRVIDRLRERCEAAALELELAPDPAQREIRVDVDPAAVEQILFNLVDNAAKYASSTEHPRLRVSVEVGRRSVSLHVRDFGPGIPATEARRIFEPFTKAKADASGTKPGVGLGLALSRRLARHMGGELELGPPPADGGADFVLTLPRARA